MKPNEQEKLFQGKYRPLADLVRPSSWENFQGLDSIDSSLIEKLKSSNFKPPSLILWGNPGCGKTTFARLIQTTSKLPFVEFSAVLGGVKDVREIVAKAKNNPDPTILFVDEIHRFNKSQQDAFLPHVENGTIILIGATTENPSFYLNSALLSRARVLKFPDLTEDNLASILSSAESKLEVTFEQKARDILVKAAGGDARKLLNLIERITECCDQKEISEKELKEQFKNNHNLFYDRSGEEHYNLISAFIKSLRGSSPDAALYWGFRMLESGEDPRFLIRRMIIFASEDIGNADPRALTLATSTLQAFEHVGQPEGYIPIAQCITYLATAPKSNKSYSAMHSALEVIKEYPKTEVPLHLRNAPTKLMKDLNYGKDYQYPHDYDGAYISDVNYFPDVVKNTKFYQPSNRGYEKLINERIAWLKQQKDSK